MKLPKRLLCFAVLSAVCSIAAAQSIPPGSTNQTLRYSATDTLAATDDFKLQADGGIVATDAATNSAWYQFFLPPGTNPPPSGTIPASGAGARVMWYPAKAAFRAGVVQSTAWDDANIGIYSTAAGIDSIASGAGATSLGGANTASGNFSTALGTGSVASGYGSTAVGDHATASATDAYAFGSSASASNNYAVALGVNAKASGYGSFATTYATANGAYSLAFGVSADNGGYTEAIAFGDGTATTKNSAHRQFMARATGGYVFYTGSGSTGAQLAAGSGSWTALSDRNEKDAIVPVDAAAVLKRVVAMPLSTWHYKAQDQKYRHMGPMAQDFYAAFNLGETDKGIDTVDADGVALAAIQGLHAKVQTQAAEIAQLREQLTQQMTLLKTQEQRLNRLFGEDARTAATNAPQPMAAPVALPNGG